MNDKQKILEYLKIRKIENCIHFTNVKNLPSIFREGILSREDMDIWDMAYEKNDVWRWDNLENAISVSVSCANYKMFYKLRQEKRSENWAVLVLDAYKVLQLDCAFCYTNAANNLVSSTSLEERKSFEAFKEMFSENVNGNNRCDLNLYDNETTDPQAEILVFDSIPKEAIEFVFFENQIAMEEYSEVIAESNALCACDRAYFFPRRDYSFW